MRMFSRLILPAAVVAAAVALIAAARAGAPPNAYVATPLVSNQGGAPFKDPNLQNAWGVAFSPSGSPFWISDNNSGKSTLYQGNGSVISSLVVTIPCPKKPGLGSSCPKISGPTGIVFNPSQSFLVPGTGSPAAFIFATEDGTISAWNLNSGTKARLVVDNSRTPNASGAVYKGLAFGVNEKGAFLFATNFRAGAVEVYDSSFKPATPSGGFKDPEIRPGFAPFGIHNIDGNLIVTYAKQNASKHDDTGLGGFVDAFDTDGRLLARLGSDPAGRSLNSPWGVARASFAFGRFAGDLVIGNFGNGWINALVPTPTGFQPQLLLDKTGLPLFIDGLWTLTAGGGLGSNPATLYYTAGPNQQTNGRFGTIAPVQ